VSLSPLPLSSAIGLDATNPVFYCNRAAAFSRIGEYQKAIDDCKQAIRYDSNYGKGN
jgi:small glutamine-rich tetratricopeptide repeat-containing protein alpha